MALDSFTSNSDPKDDLKKTTKHTESNASVLKEGFGQQSIDFSKTK